jgi:Cof subfamily protein (haloacid dehalogenase superfamily)
MIGFHQELRMRGPLVTCNGGVVYLRAKIIRECFLPHAIADNLVDYAHCNNITALSYVREGVIVSSRNHWNEPADRHINEGTVDVLFSQPKRLRRKNIHQLVLVDVADRLDAVHDHVRQLSTGCNVYRLYEEMIVVTPLGAEKSQGIEAAAKHYGFTLDQVATIGDGSNDIGMLSRAGYSVAMHHGHPDAKAAAKMVAPPTDPNINFAAAVDLLLTTYAT